MTYYNKKTYNIACMGTVSCDFCARCSFCVKCFNCADCEECEECTNCNFCINCQGLVNASLRINNEPATIEKFFEVAQFHFDSEYLRKRASVLVDNCENANGRFIVSERMFGLSMGKLLSDLTSEKEMLVYSIKNNEVYSFKKINLPLMNVSIYSFFDLAHKGLGLFTEPNNVLKYYSCFYCVQKLPTEIVENSIIMQKSGV